MNGLEYVRTYLDDLLVLSNKSFEDHLQWIEEVLERLATAGLKFHTDKSTFCASQID